jgi:hypothetical protein
MRGKNHEGAATTPRRKGFPGEEERMMNAIFAIIDQKHYVLGPMESQVICF